MKIRIATPEDASAIQSIYRYYVEHTAITFELEVPSVEEFQGRIKKILERYPYLVAEEDRVIIGYAYAGIFYDRRAYDWSAEMSVYVQKGIHGKGVGTALYEKMEELLKKQHIVNLFACITHPNAERTDSRILRLSVFHTAFRTSPCTIATIHAIHLRKISWF